MKLSAALFAAWAQSVLHGTPTCSASGIEGIPAHALLRALEGTLEY
jgi:hypothetical protein